MNNLDHNHEMVFIELVLTGSRHEPSSHHYTSPLPIRHPITGSANLHALPQNRHALVAIFDILVRCRNKCKEK